MGAVALFDQKYGSEVRVVSIGDYSKELCGGTHVGDIAEIGLFKIISEVGIAAGVRRIEALTGRIAFDFLLKQEALLEKTAALLKAKPDQLYSRVERLVAENKEQAREINLLKQQMAGSQVEEILEQVQEVGGVKVLVAKLKGVDGNSLRKIGDQLKQKLGSGVIVLASQLSDKVLFVTMVTDDLLKQFHAGKIVGQVAKVAGGGGGGRADMAQAGGKDVSKIDAALKKGLEMVRG